ncbi:MAG: glycerate kinase [Candidatus Adiutrix sp.]|jgi:glycerate kinase|nr:glycerate kinase [Candidatus Adiutrix sp.]
MKIVIAPDSFKGSLSAPEAAEAIRRGLAQVWPEADYCLFPVADGGEGTVEILVDLSGGDLRPEKVQDPLGRTVEAFWGLLGDGRTAVVETAAAAGLTRLENAERDPAVTSTFGLGQLIKKALARPAVERLLIGLGGSATNDGGVGMLSALGARFLDSSGRPIPPGGLGLLELAEIDLSGLDPRLKEVSLIVVGDVQNSLTGPEGASAVFGPQKGAGPDLVRRLDEALSHYARLATRATGRQAAARPGAGAAGGLGAAFLFFTEAEFRPGGQLVLEEGAFRQKAAGADLIVTGEGQSDYQTACGKAPVGVAALGHELGIPTVLLSGALGQGYQDLYRHHIAGMMSLAPGPLDLDRAMAEAPQLLEEAAVRLARLLSIQIKHK